MIKQTVINAELFYAMTQARHKDTIIICDANMPIPKGCHVIDISLVRGVPTMMQTMKAILNDLVIERYEVFELMPLYNLEKYKEIQNIIPNIPNGTIGQDNLYKLMVEAKVVVRTGDMGSCCTIVLFSASGMNKYVEKFECSFE